jgi:hypothetical protein
VAGFGSHTPVYSGETMCIRYYSNFSKAARLLHDLIANQQAVLRGSNDGAIDISTIVNLGGLLQAKTAKDIWDAIGQDAWIAIPIRSTMKKRDDKSLDTLITELEGSRLTVCRLKSSEIDINDRFSIQACQLEESSQGRLVPKHTSRGYEFSIRTPITPKRWESYACELDDIFHELIKALRSDDSANLLSTALLLAFYWYNFMPLARGSAFCGYVMILACRLAGGLLGSQKIPDGVQLDWQAILEPDPERFVELMSSWILEDPAALGSVPAVSDGIPDVTSSLPTFESRIAVLRHFGHD